MVTPGGDLPGGVPPGGRAPGGGAPALVRSTPDGGKPDELLGHRSVGM